MEKGESIKIGPGIFIFSGNCFRYAGWGSREAVMNFLNIIRKASAPSKILTKLMAPRKILVKYKL